MKKLFIIVLLVGFAAPADAQSWKQWWKHHHILCMCIGNPPVFGGN